MLETISVIWNYRPPFLFELIFISLLFLRPSQSYDFEAFLAVGFGIFIAYALQLTPNLAMRALVIEFYNWGSVPLITSLIFFFIGIRQFSTKSFFYPEFLDHIIESPFGLLLLSLFLAFYNRLYFFSPLDANFPIMLIRDLILWTIGGSIIVTIKNTVSESFLHLIFGTIVIFLGSIMLVRILPFAWIPHFYF